jgi:hypothetical protein
MYVDQPREVVGNHLRRQHAIAEITVDVPLGTAEGNGVHPCEELLELVVGETTHGWPVVKMGWGEARGEDEG